MYNKILKLSQDNKIILYPMLVLTITIWFNFVPFVDYYDMVITDCESIKNGVSCGLENNNLHYETSVDYWYGEVKHHKRMSDSENYNPVSWTFGSIHHWLSVKI